jgi:hypothetical protein
VENLENSKQINRGNPERLSRSLKNEKVIKNGSSTPVKINRLTTQYSVMILNMKNSILYCTLLSCPQTLSFL